MRVYMKTDTCFNFVFAVLIATKTKPGANAK